MDKSHPLLNESRQNSSSLITNNIYDKIQQRQTLIKEKDLYLQEDNEVTYSKQLNNPKNYKIFLEILDIMKLSFLLNKQVEIDCFYIILNVRYKKESNHTMYSWEIKKSYFEIKELLFQVS